MAASEFGSIWMLMSKHSFETDCKSLSANLSCGICEKLMIDACHSSCGCQYCHKCVSDYIGNDRKYCPGGKEDCQYEYLVLDKSVFRNQVLNRKIMLVKVRCPNESCECDIELAQMEDHLRVCSKRQIKCPYVQIGCDSEDASKDSILTHLSSDTLGHSELLIEFIHNLRNEVDVLKDTVNVCKLEMSTLREECRIKDTRIGEIIVQMEDQRREMECVKEESMKKESRITSLEKELGEVRNEVELRLSKLTAETDEREARMEEQRRTIDDVRSEMREGRDDIIKSVTEMGLVTEKRVHNLVTFCPNIDDDFVWIIREFSKIGTKTEELFESTKEDNIDVRMEKFRKEGLLSDSFYSHNYHLGLGVLKIGDGILLYCHILKGVNDDKVQWPMKLNVTLGIVNQDTLRTHSSVKLHCDTYGEDKCVFDRVTDINNDVPIMGLIPIRYSSIKNNKSVVLEDSVIVSCRLN